jgi:hypothetical protein
MKTHLLRKWLLYLTVILSTGITIISCRNENASFPDPGALQKGLTGSWVEKSTKSDTIIFNSDKETELLFLHPIKQFLLS